MKYDPARVLTLLLGVIFALAGVDLPEPERGLEEGTHTYVAHVSMGGQNMTMNVVRAVEKVDDGWRVTERVEGPMGEAVDSEVLRDPSLTPVERTMTQGPIRFDLRYTGESVEGTLTMQGNEQQIEVDLDGPIFSDGAGAYLVMAALPLKDGYEARYRTLDLMAQKVTQMRLEVTGAEQITVPAGTFDAFRIEIGPIAGDPGGTTLWIDRMSRKVVKTQASLPQMSGATITSELQAEDGDSE